MSQRSETRFLSDYFAPANEKGIFLQWVVSKLSEQKILCLGLDISVKAVSLLLYICVSGAVKIITGR